MLQTGLKAGVEFVQRVGGVVEDQGLRVRKVGGLAGKAEAHGGLVNDAVTYNILVHNQGKSEFSFG